MPYILGKLGRHKEAKAIIEYMSAEARGIEPVLLAMAHMGVGDTDKALDAIDAGLNANPYLTGQYIRTQFEFEVLKEHPRFREQLRKLEEMERV